MPIGKIQSKRKFLLYRLRKQRKQKEKLTLEVINDTLNFADELDRQILLLDISDTTLSVAGIMGSGLFVSGFVLSFVTAGASLGLTIAGGVISGSCGVGGLVSHMSRKVIIWKKKKKIKAKINKVILLESTINETIRDIIKVLSCVGGTIGSGVTVASSAVKMADLATDVTPLVQGSMIAGKVSAKSTAVTKTVFKSLSPVNKIFHFVGIGTCVIGLLADILTIVDRSIKIHKKIEPKASEEMRRLAYRLKGPYKHLPSKCEKRMIDRDDRLYSL